MPIVNPKKSSPKLVYRSFHFREDIYTRLLARRAKLNVPISVQVNNIIEEYINRESEQDADKGIKTNLE
jgi:hypothetical protein